MLFIPYGTPHQEPGTLLIFCQSDLSSLAVWRQIVLACMGGGGYPQSLAAHSPCLQGIIKAQPVPTHGCICESLHTVINPRPATSISTHNIIRKQAEQRITEPAPGLGIMARPIRAGRGENDVLF